MDECYVGAQSEGAWSLRALPEPWLPFSAEAFSWFVQNPLLSAYSCMCSWDLRDMQPFSTWTPGEKEVLPGTVRVMPPRISPRWATAGTTLGAEQESIHCISG